MEESSFGDFDQGGPSHWLRLRTLIVLRWVAICGQIAAITVGQRVFGLQLELGFCYLVIGTAVVANLIAIFVFPENRRLSETEALWTLMFDLAQLAALVLLTGGLSNPFALLLLTPVIIAASTLRAQSILIMGAMAISLITVAAFIHLPLMTDDGSLMVLPDVFLFGYWLAMIIGVLFIAFYARRVSVEVHAMSDALLATRLALAREQKLTDLGGVVAAAAHELGTPLATIKLVSTELIEELQDLEKVPPHLLEDAELVRSQADRCREILRSMGRAGKGDLHMRLAPLEAVIQEAAEPHMSRGKSLHLTVAPVSDAETRQPSIYRRPEIIHGLRNLIQNAVDFAEASIWIDARWDDQQITLTIVDDGQGFPPQLLGRIGDPFVRNRRSDPSPDRPEYEGMGLGLFIAKTLLERSGAELTFANAADPFLPKAQVPERCGALVAARWPRDVIGPDPDNAAQPLGENSPIEA